MKCRGSNACMSGMAERSSKLGHLGIGSAGAWKHCRETLRHSLPKLGGSKPLYFCPKYGPGMEIMDKLPKASDSLADCSTRRLLRGSSWRDSHRLFHTPLHQEGINDVHDGRSISFVKILDAFELRQESVVLNRFLDCAFGRSACELFDAYAERFGQLA